MKKILVLIVLVLSQYSYSQDVNLTGEISDTVIVTSSRYQKNINELPYSAAIIGLDKISTAPSQSVPELLRAESGISLIRDGIWGAEINIRGLSRSNVVALIDGNRVETSNDISARLSMIDLNDIDRIEVIKGAASTLYGTGAMGGVVNIISKQDNYSNSFFLKGSLNSGYNSVNNNYLSGLNLSAGAERWTARLTGSFRRADNTKTPAGTIANSQYKDNSLSGALNLKPLDDQELKLIFQQFNAENVGIPGGNGVFPANATVRYPEERRKMFSAEYDINNISNSLRKISAKYFYQYMLRDVENIPHQVKTVAASNGQPAKRVNVLEIDPTAEHNSYGLQFQSDFTLGSNYYLIAGVDYWQRRYTGIRTNSQKIEILGANGATVKTMYKTTYDKALPDATYGSTGFFVNNEIGLIEKKLKLLLGGRFDLINIKNDETKSPLYDITDGTVNYTPAGQTILWKAGTAKNTSYTYSAGLLYSLSEHSSLSFNAARSFRSPSLEERYQYIDQGSYIRIGDPQLKPEKGYFLDLGLRTNGNGLRTRTSIFYNYLNDLVTEITGTYQGRNAFIKTNIGEASLYGFELETSYDILSSLGVYHNISFVRGKDLKAENDLPQIPPLNGNAGIRFYLIKEMTADISAVYFAAQNKVAPGEIKTPGYVYFNIDISSSMISLGPLNLRLICGAENILDKEYRNHLSTNRGSITTEPGRNIYIKTNIAW